MSISRSALGWAALPMVLWSLAGAGSAVGKRVVIGRSVRGRPIVAWSFGPDRASRKILVVGCIHGNECAGLAITSALRHTRVPRGAQLWLVPEMNPDGTAADTRQNAHGVDLNRNFPYRWRPISDPTYYSGPYPASEPETRAAMRLVRRIRPAVTVWYHQHINLVDLSGGDRGVARRYAQLAGLRATCLTFLSGKRQRGPTTPSPAPRHSWSNFRRAAWGPTRWRNTVRAIRGIERGRRSGSPTRCGSITPAA